VLERREHHGWCYAANEEADELLRFRATDWNGIERCELWFGCRVDADATERVPPGLGCGWDGKAARAEAVRPTQPEAAHARAFLIYLALRAITAKIGLVRRIRDNTGILGTMLDKAGNSFPFRTNSAPNRTILLYSIEESNSFLQLQLKTPTRHLSNKRSAVAAPPATFILDLDLNP